MAAITACDHGTGCCRSTGKVFFLCKGFKRLDPTRCSWSGLAGLAEWNKAPSFHPVHSLTRAFGPVSTPLPDAITTEELLTVVRRLAWDAAAIQRGDADLYVSLSGRSAPKDWDMAAPEAGLLAAGGAFTHADGRPLNYNTGRLEQAGCLVARHS